MNLQKITLGGTRVVLTPLSREHLDGLAKAINDGRLWEIRETTVPFPDALEAFLRDAEQAHLAGRELAFATLDKRTGKVVGSTRFRNIDAAHRRTEIGFTFLSRSVQRTHVNTEAKYLMLCHAFDVWQCNRVEFVTDERNVQSRRAIQRVGGVEEGVLRKHMIMRDGHVRNSIMYSITRDEWPGVKTMLTRLMYRPA